MTIRYQTQDEHDQVVMASAATYEHLKKAGYLVSVNPNGQQNHDIGGGIFPDVVIWRPGGENGHSLIIEEIETAETIRDKDALEWARYARLGITFYLVVPRQLVEQTRQLLSAHRITVNRLEAYWIENGQVKFDTRV
jgi:hypothetical protein